VPKSTLFLLWREKIRFYDNLQRLEVTIISLAPTEQRQLPSTTSHSNQPSAVFAQSDSCRICFSGIFHTSVMLYSVILPTYNERENLPIIYFLIDKTFTDAKLNYEVVIVDDSSPDRTLDVAQAIQKSYGQNHVTIVSRQGKLGLGTAYVAGLQAAKGERIILMDADLSHHPKFIPSMIDLMDSTGVDIVTGTRYANGGGVYGWNWKRKLTSTGANFLAHFLLRSGDVSDLTGSFRLYERRVLEQILPQIQCKGYAFQMEIIVRSKKAGFRVGEVGISFVDRIYGQSKLGPKEIIMYVQGLLQLFFTT
jgi:dolichol-phosphate mannosyltransferase